jgi:tetratricopeptide (TPR) repeat protein
MEKDAETEQRLSLREILARIESAENHDWAIFNLSLDSARKRDAELPEILHACAIPRRFDSCIIGILRDKPDDEDRNWQLQDMVSAQNFVSKREDGGYSYHDAIRDAVLEDWRSSTEKQEQFVKLNVRLADFYEEEHAKAQRSEQDLIFVSSVMRQANINRYRTLASALEKQLLMPLLEALYHRLLASPAQGFSSFRDWFHKQEEDGHLMICQALISATRDFLLRLPSDQQDQKHTDWLDYFEARTLRQLPPFDFRRAEEKFRELSARKNLEAQLRIWVLNELSIVQVEQQKMREVVSTRKELLTLVEESGEDVYNWPIYFANLGKAYWDLDGFDHAIRHFRSAIETSDTNVKARKDSLVFGRLDLSGVYCDAGQWDKGIENGVEALYLARTEFADSRPIQTELAYRLMWLLSAYDARAADTAAAECIYLSQAVEQWKLAAHERYIAALDNSGRTGFAEFQLQKLREETDRSESPQLHMPSLLFREALVYESYGNEEEAIKKYSELLDLSKSDQVNNWTRAAALSNRGGLLTIEGRWESAEEDLRAALKLWKDYGHETSIANIHVLLANLHRRSGLLSEAQKELDQAAREFGMGVRPYEGGFYITQGDVHFYQGNWKEALKHYKKALEISNARKERRSAAKALQKLSVTAIEEGDWKSASEFAARAGLECNELAVLDAYRPSATDEEANKKNAEGIRLFCEGSDITQACELFRSALEDAPSNFWYQLNLAFANAKREYWHYASQAMGKALEIMPEPMRTARLYRCWRDYLIKYAKSYYRNRDYATVVQIISDALGTLEPLLPTIDLVHLRLRLGDYLWSAGRSSEARQAYAIGAEQVENLEMVYEQLQFATRRAVLDAVDGQLSSAITSLDSCLGRVKSEDTLSNAFVEVADIIQSRQQFHGFAELLRALIFARGITSDTVKIINERLLDLTEQRYRPTIYPLGRSKPPREYQLQPVVRPIALEITAGLAQTRDTPGIRWMLDEGFPEMRDRILKEIGVRVPGVRIRSNKNTPPGGYFHSLFDSPLPLNMVYEGKRFCPEAMKCREIGVSGLEAPNYGPSGGNGLWLDESQWTKAEDANLPLKDPYEYMTSHTESVIRAHLISFFGVQELRNTLDNWVNGAAPFDSLSEDQRETRQRLVDAAALGDRAFQRLLCVLQALIRENVPILRLDRILTELTAPREGEERDVGELVNQVRMALREDLPGNRDHRTLIEIPEKLEYSMAAGIHRQDGKVFFALPPEQAQEFLSEVRSILAENPEIKPALVVSLAEVRPLVSAVLALEIPDVPVLARQELVDAEGKEQL